MCQKATAIDYKLVVSQKIATNDEIISPNGGSFKVGTAGTNISSDLTITFPSNRDWVGISANTEAGISGFNGDYAEYPGLPKDHFPAGYWFNKWIGTTEMIPNYLKTISSKTAWATQSPKKDFSVSANWMPNKFYISYNGNNNTNTMMANTAHDYNSNVSLYPNRYLKSSKIIFNPRDGNYNANDWVE
jgi:hypothetical protein